MNSLPLLPSFRGARSANPEPRSHAYSPTIPWVPDSASRFRNDGLQKAMVIFLAALLAACAPGQAPKQEEPAIASSVPAPTPQDVSLRIDAAQAGQSVAVPVGQRFAVELVGVPTAGYVWTPAQVPAFLTRAGEASGPTTRAQSQPGFTGGNHWEVLMFAATAPGSGELVLEQRRPWETTEPPANVFRVTIVAR